MTTTLNKPVKRRTQDTIRDGGKPRRVVVTLYPAGHIGLRLEGRRSEETISLDAVYRFAIRARVAVERMDKAKDKKANQKMRRKRYV